jgi:DNA-binding PadR family transcriptional regulator
VTSKRKVSNPLALAVLALLAERPMHPYEMAFTLRLRRKEESIKLNYGSLYTVVEALLREELVSVKEVVREGKRPERTIYQLTDAGAAEVHDWERELLAEPVKEYPQFMAGLALLPILSPADAAAALRERAAAVEQEAETLRTGLEALTEQESFPRVLLIESEYELVLRDAELAWVRELAAQLETGELDGTRRSPGGEVTWTFTEELGTDRKARGADSAD